MSLFSQLRAAVQRRAAYNRTVHELRSLDARLAEDVGLLPGTPEQAALRSIYG